MPVPAVRLKIRLRLSNGSRACVDPVYSSNGKLKALQRPFGRSRPRGVGTPAILSLHWSPGSGDPVRHMARLELCGKDIQCDEKLDLGFSPKDKEEVEIPIPRFAG